MFTHITHVVGHVEPNGISDRGTCFICAADGKIILPPVERRENVYFFALLLNGSSLALKGSDAIPVVVQTGMPEQEVTVTGSNLFTIYCYRGQWHVTDPNTKSTYQSQSSIPGAPVEASQEAEPVDVE